MTQVFDEAGKQIPVTVLEVGPCVVVQRKTAENDGYDAVQIGYSEQKAQRLSKAVQGHYKKSETSPCRFLREVRVDSGHEAKAGDTFTAGMFEEVSHVDVTAVTKGRGFQGPVKRWNMKGGRATHGGKGERRIGSIGMCVSPARVLRGRKMAGHMGSRTRTTENLKLVQVRADDNVILVKGGVPGPNGATVFVRISPKKVAS